MVPWVKFFVQCPSLQPTSGLTPVLFSASPSRCGRAPFFPSSSPTWAVPLSVLWGFISCPHPPKLGTWTPGLFRCCVGGTFHLQLP